MVDMAHIIEQKEGKNFSAVAKILEPHKLKSALSPLAWKILQTLSQSPSYPKQIGKKLKVHEQKVYYHIRNLQTAGLIEKVGEESKLGATAKFYAPTHTAFAILLKPMEPAQKIFSLSREQKKFLEPFVLDGKINAKIIMGSPEPHGPAKTRAKDGPAAAQFALFLGTFLHHSPPACVKIDTELRPEEMKENLILIGGPRVNAITAKLNPRLPIKFIEMKQQANFFSSIYSEFSDKHYTEEEGMIVKAKNPFSKEKEILVIAGKGNQGTRAALLALLQKFDEVCAGNKRERGVFAKVVEGVDRDNDGVVDAVEILE
ncbi:MAG TPA: S-layer protein [archaeon]|nr:S-layer protein [archaeon]